LTNSDSRNPEDSPSNQILHASPRPDLNYLCQRHRPSGACGRIVVRQLAQENLFEPNANATQEKEGYRFQEIVHRHTIAVTKEKKVANQRGVANVITECFSEEETIASGGSGIADRLTCGFAAPEEKSFAGSQPDGKPVTVGNSERLAPPQEEGFADSD
jgi:hypothetical protein